MPTDEEHILDELLVIEAQCGDRACMDLLVDRWAGRIRGAARRLTQDDAGADDVSQEAWVAIARGLARLRDPTRFGAWASGIVRRKAADWVAARSRHRREGEVAAARIDRRGPDVPGEDLQRLRAAIRDLPPDRRLILFLLYKEELGVSQIALLLGVPVGTVKSRLHQARADLRALVQSPQTPEGASP